MLDAVQQGLFDKAKRNLEDNTYACSTVEEVKEKMATQGGFAKTMWCGDEACELTDEGDCRGVLPLHPPGAGAPGGRVPHLRQARQAYGVLGAWPTDWTDNRTGLPKKHVGSPVYNCEKLPVAIEKRWVL